VGGIGLKLHQLMIMDACVLIDFIHGDPKLFKLISSHIGPIFVATPVVEEVDSIHSIEELESLGLIPFEPDIDDLFSADAMSGQTSFQDNLCFLIAKRQGFTCISNDKVLRKKCIDSNISVVWGLELLLWLRKANGITSMEAIRIAREIQKTNPRHISITILKDFEAKAESFE
jgi:hypothetical protein